MVKNKMVVVASNIDDSIKSQTSIYDVIIFKSFLDLEKYAEESFIHAEVLVVSARDLMFTSSNMERLMNVINAPFTKITGNVLYLIDQSTIKSRVDKFIQDSELKNWVVYQGDLGTKFMSDIISGVGRGSQEGQVDIVTYRMRASEYFKQAEYDKYTVTDDKYQTDDDDLAGIPDVAKPEPIVSYSNNQIRVNYVCGDNSLERTLIVFLLAQYKALSGKAVIIERDDYHMLTEMVTKSGIDCEFIQVSDLYKDVKATLQTIRHTKKSLVVIGAIKRFNYDYNFVCDLLESNLRDDVQYLIRECTLDEIPFGKQCSVIFRNTVPDVLRMCNEIQYSINTKDISFVGVQLGKLGAMNLTSAEIRDIISKIMCRNDITAQTMHVNGILLKGEDTVYDILGVFNRGN